MELTVCENRNRKSEVNSYYLQNGALGNRE